MLTKNILIKYSLLIKSILLLPNDNRMNKKTNKLLWCIRHLDLRSLLSLCGSIKQ
jgi:hypothetical protein